ncbi:5-formyltetrahydrofolate cyclo-ligase [Deinococcus aquiradiocola]|uniref:5-formyltetrahydrofolate cyclo-ligase n=1 Tax=Deinococcus aquiradiocola TaxID=393059 RepID=UPI001E5FD4D4|nr:5-formyltetrahydrofolate cyclo-ligase [Deinococcus aquiradiocola]
MATGPGDEPERTDPRGTRGPTMTAGATRDALWSALLRDRVATYPLPPHGHHPNFVGAREAAAALLAHPAVQRHACLIVGAERALYPLRRQALAAGVTLYVPDQKRDGWYFRVRDARGADLKALREHGEPHLQPVGATAAVLACVAVDRAGGRLSKGFGWGARGVPRLPDLPVFTVAHPAMLQDALPCPPDSRVQVIGLPGEALHVQGPDAQTPSPPT